MLQRFKLRLSIIIQLCLVFVLGFFIQGYLSTSFIHKTYVKNLQQDQFNRATAIADSIDRKLQSTHQSLISVSQVFPLQNLDNADLLQSWLDDRRGLIGTFDNGLFIFGTTGELLIETPFKPDRRGRSYSFRSYYQETVKTGQPHISDPYISSQRHNHPSIMMTAPIYDNQGKLIAILGGSFDLLGGNFLGGLSQQKLGETGYFYLAGLDRTIIVHPDSTRIMQRDVPAGANPLFDRAMTGFEGCEETVNSRGLVTLTAFKRLQSKQWILGGNYPMSEINAPLSQTRKILWLSIGGTFLAMLLLSIFSFNQIFGPLYLFAEHLSSLSRKQGKERLFPYKGKGEIATLITTFNKALQEADAAQQKLDYAQKMAHLGNWSWDIANNTLAWSDEVFRIFGDSPKSFEPSFEIFMERIHQDDRAIVNQAIEQAMADKQSYEIEHRIVLDDGSLRYVREQGEVQKTLQGDPSGMVGTVQDISEIIRLQNRLRELATIDELTGAVNRRQFFILAEQLRQRAIRYGGTFSLIFYDLDHFKRVNDLHGHPAGDDVLRETTAKIQTLLRNTDTLARYGGEEFCILAAETAGENTEVLAEKIRAAVEKMEITLKTGQSLKLTISVGMASYQDSDTVSSLLDRADQAVYRAKELGRNRIFRC